MVSPTLPWWILLFGLLNLLLPQQINSGLILQERQYAKIVRKIRTDKYEHAETECPATKYLLANSQVILFESPQ